MASHEHGLDLEDTRYLGLCHGGVEDWPHEPNRCQAKLLVAVRPEHQRILLGSGLWLRVFSWARTPAPTTIANWRRFFFLALAAPCPLPTLALIVGCSTVKTPAFAPVLHRATGELQVCRVLLCVKLLGNFCLGITWPYNFEAPVLRQASGELQLGGCCFASSKVLEDYSLQGAVCPKLLGDCNFEARASCHAIGEMQLAGACFASRSSSYCGVPSCRLASCISLLGNYNLQGRVRYILQS